LLLAVLFLLPHGLVSLPRRIVQLVNGIRHRGRWTVIGPPGGDTARGTAAEPESPQQTQ
jgi:hypothetical protein